MKKELVYINAVDSGENTAQASFERNFISFLLSKKDLNVIIITLNSESIDDRVLSIPLDKRSYISYLLWNLRLIFLLYRRKVLFSSRDNYVIYFRQSGLMMPAKVILRLLRFKIFYRCESLYDNLYDYKKVKLRWLKPFIYLYEWIDLRLSTKNIVVTNMLVRRLVERYKLNREKVVCISNPANIRFHEVLQASSRFVDGRFNLGYFGSLKEFQRIQDVIVAISLLKKRKLISEISFRFYIYGDGPYREDLIQLVSRLCLDDIVFFQGAFVHEDLPSLYNDVDVVVAPYSKHWDQRKGSSALKIWEYLFFNKFVIAPDILDYRFLEEMKFGRLYEIENVISLSEVLKKCIKDRPEIGHLKGRDYILKHRAPERVFSKYLQVFGLT